MRIALAAAALALLLTVAAAPLEASSRATDPILGTWQMTGGGSGTFVIEGSGGSAYRMKGKTALTLYCASAAAGDTLGIVEPRGEAGAPADGWKMVVSNRDNSCSTEVILSMSGDTVSGEAKDFYSDEVRGEVSFHRVGGKEPPPGKMLLSWTMPTRFGNDVNGNHLVDYFKTPNAISPAHWPVEVKVASSVGGGCPEGAFVFHVAGVLAHGKRKDDCDWEVQFPKQGQQRLTAAVTDAGQKYSGAATVNVRDFLIFGLGDSNGSGEGDPDVPGTTPLWEDERCDRSARSFEPQAAMAIDGYNPQTSVTFVHLACSGASIPEGLIGSYGGINDPGGPNLAPQVKEMEKLKGKREIDAVLLSIGVNDIDFSPLVAFCLAEDDCMDKPYPTPGSHRTLSAAIAGKLRVLPNRYAALAKTFDKLRVADRRVYITQYPDSTHQADAATFCDPLISVAGSLGGTFDQAEARWAYLHVLTPLNRAVAAAATRYHWRMISGVPGLFAPHGYCSSDPWIVGLTESFANEGSRYGTLHANAKGHQAVAQLVATLLAIDLFPAGKPRPL
jgi:lysophospholipase L1-like esterase